MSDATVDVKVKLPKPPQGWEWSECNSGRCDGPHFNDNRHTFWQHQVVPPERTVMVPMRESLARTAIEGWTNADWRAIQDAIRKALVQQEVCGVEYSTGTRCSDHSTQTHHDYCRLCQAPKGLAGAHSPPSYSQKDG